MGSRFVKRWLSLLLVLSMVLSMSVSAFAVGTDGIGVSVTAADYTKGSATVEFPSEWTSGMNTFDVTCSHPCAAFVTRADGTHERLYCAIVDAEAGHYRFQVSSQEGDAISVFMKGDADRNGRVNIMDLTRVNQYLGSSYDLPGVFMYAGDCDQNGRVNIMDATRLNQYLVNKYEFIWDIGWEIEDEPVVPPVPDADGDGIPDADDTDDDNDGIPDVEDSDHPDYIEPENPSDLDTDKDGIVDSLDPDDDNDGIKDIDDPNHPAYDPDTDGDGMRDSLDKDDDGDGILDENDPDHPDYVAPVEPDTDGDGIVDSEDDDDDNDGILDTDDEDHPDYVAPDADGDGIPDVDDEDDDGDGIPDVEDEDHPDYIAPEDPNLDAAMTLDASVNTVHIGDDVVFTLEHDIEGEYELEYLLMVDESVSRLNISSLTSAGGNIVFDEQTGLYTLVAMAVTETGLTVTSNVVSISVTNTKPVINNIGVELTYEDNTSGYVEGAKIRVDIDVDASDADGDTYELKYVVGDGYISADGTYLDEGTYTIGVYAVDQWGAESEIFYYPVEVKFLDTVPVIYTDSEVVHIGDVFNVYVNEDVLEDKISKWTLYDSEGNIVEFDQSNMTKSGGTMCVESGTGIYTLHAIGVDEYGVEFDMETLTIGVENNRPGTAIVTHTVVTNEFESPFTTNARIYVEFDASAIDPDGDDTTVYFVNTNGGADYEPTGGYYSQGKHTVTVYCVDEWGLAGDKTTYTFTVGNAAPSAPLFDVNVDYDDWKYIDGELCVYVEITAEATDPDGNPVQIEFAANSAVSGYYPAGRYTVSAHTVDPWLAQSKISSHTFDVILTETSMTANGSSSELTVHIGDEFEIVTSVGAYDVSWVSYRLLDSDGNTVGQVGDMLTETGGMMSISTAVGDYTLVASAMLTDGSIVPVGEIIIHVVNEAPLKPTVSAFVDYSNATSLSDIGHFGQLGAYTTITYSTTDPDGDEFTWVPVEDTDKYVTKNDYLVDGTYTVWVQAVDEWGAKSEPVEYKFTVKFTEFPSITPTDVNVHLGEEFAVSVQHGTLDVYKMEYKITDENGNTEIYSDLGLYGGMMSIDTAKGVYLMRAVAKLQDGSLYEVGVVNITVGNRAPVASVDGHAVLENTDGDLRVRFTTDAYDPDGDEYTAYYALDDGRFAELSENLELVCEPGEHVLTVYAVDQWGAESEVVEYEFAVETYIDAKMQPEISYTVTDQFKNGYTTNATRFVDFDVEWMLDGVGVTIDTSSSTVYYLVNGKVVSSLDAYYALGEYTIEVYAVDSLGTETKHGTCTMVLTNETPVVTLGTEGGYIVESVTDDEDFLKVVRKAEGYVIDSFDVLEAGTFELTLTATDIWGAVGTVTDTLTIAAQPPVLRIDGHTVTDRNVKDHLGYVEFDFVKLNYVPEEYTLYYTVDGKTDTGLDDWFTLEEHTVQVYAKHNTLPDRVSNTVTYTFDLTNHAPDTPVVEAIVDRTDIQNAYTKNASVWTTFDVHGSDPDGDDITLYWLYDGEVVDSVDGYFKIGTHYVEAYAVDVWGLQSQVAEYQLVIANDAPVIQSVSHIVNMKVTGTTASGESGVWVEFPTTIVEPNGDKYTVTYVIDGQEVVNGCYLTAGSHTLQVEAVDSWGKYSNLYEYEFSMDNDPPTAPVVTYTLNTDDVSNPYTSDAVVPMYLHGTSTDPDGDDVTIYWSIGDASLTGENVESTKGIGDVLVYTWAVDSFCNRSTTTVTQVSLTSDVPVTSTTWDLDVSRSRYPFTTMASAYITFNTAVKDSDPYELYYSVDGGEFTTESPSGFYRQGEYTIRVYAVDIWGNKSNVETVLVDLENEAPETPVVSYTENRDVVLNAYTADATYLVEFDGTSSDSDGDEYVVYYRMDNGAWTESLTGYYSIGTYKVEAYAVDFWGAQSLIATKNVYLQNTNPVITNSGFSSFTMDDIVNPYTVNAYVPVTVGGAAYDRDGDDYKMTVIMDGKQVDAGTVFNLGVGEYSVEVQAVDKFGGQSQPGTATIKIGGSAPVITNVSHILGSDFTNAYTKSAKRQVTMNPTVKDPDDDPYRVYTTVNGVSTGSASGYYGLGTYNVSLKALDIWGMESGVYDYAFTLTNTKPNDPSVEGVIDWDKVTNPYTKNAKVWVDVTKKASDPDNDAIRTYYSVDGSAYSYTGGNSFESGYYQAGTRVIKAYSMDPWGEQSATITYEFEISSEIDVSINKPSLFGSGFTTSGNTVSFTASVDAKTPYKFAWLNFYEAGKPVTVNGYDLTGTTQTIGQTSWKSQAHMLVVQAMNILGEADYDSFYFQTGVSGDGGSVTIVGTTSQATTPALKDDKGNVLSYVVGFEASVPTISGHGSGNQDYLQVIGITADGKEEELGKAIATGAKCHIVGTNGNGSWTGDGTPASGSFSYNTNKYISVKFTFYSPHQSCMERGGVSMNYSVTYGFTNSQESLDNMAALFGDE